MAVMSGGSRAPFIMNSPESITTYVPIKGSTDGGISVMTANSPTLLGHDSRVMHPAPSPRRGGRWGWGASAGGRRPDASPPPWPSSVSGGFAQKFKDGSKVDRLRALNVNKLASKPTFWAKPSQGEGSRCALLTSFDLESQGQWANAYPHPRAEPPTQGAVFSGLGLIQTTGFDRRER
jgi:hypothetical protein